MITEMQMLKIHEIISLIYSSKNLTVMRKQFNKLIKELVYYDCATFDMGKTRNNNVNYVTDSIIDSNLGSKWEKDFTYQYETKYAAVDYVRWTFSNSESLVYRTSDLVNDSLRRKSSFFSQYLKPFGLDYAAGIVLTNNNKFLAALTLFRKENVANFTDDELYILKQFIPHLVKRFFGEPGIQERMNTTNSSDLMRQQYGLTKREIEIIGYIYCDYKNNDIANVLGIAPNTIKKHVTNIYSKIGVTDKVALFKFIVANNLRNIWDDL